MKLLRVVVLAAALLIPCSAVFSQAGSVKSSARLASLSGSWQGTFAGGAGPRILLRVESKGDGVLRAVLYEMDRSPRPLVANDFLIDGRDFEFSVGAINVRFAGTLDTNQASVTGVWTQGGASKPLTLKHEGEATAWAIPEPRPKLRPPVNAAGTTYEVATVKPASPYAQGSGMRVSGPRLEALNMSLNDLIQFSYGIHESQIEGLPERDGKKKFDATLLYPGDEYPNDAQCKAMVKQLLSERFGLEFHRATKEQNAYTLTLAKGGPKLAKSEGDPNGLPGMHFNAPGVFGAQNTSMSDFANELQRSVMNRPVVDNTGLTGRFDFALEWAPDELQFGGRAGEPNANSGKPDIQKALEEQLGLRLESRKTSVTIFSIDHAEMPGDN